MLECFLFCQSSIESPKRGEVSETLMELSGTVNLKGGPWCIRWGPSTPYQRTKWKQEAKKKEESERMCVPEPSPTPAQGPVSFIRNGRSLSSRCPLLATQRPLGLASIPPGKCSWSQIWPKDFFHYPPTFPFTSNLKAGPWLSLWSWEYKDVGPSGLTRRALLSITASPSLLPFTPGSWTHRCQPGNNPQTIADWKPGLDTLLATYLLLLAAVEA